MNKTRIYKRIMLALVLYLVMLGSLILLVGCSEKVPTDTTEWQMVRTCTLVERSTHYFTYTVCLYNKVN